MGKNLKTGVYERKNGQNKIAVFYGNDLFR